jgi:nitric oxide reductase subunit C
VRFKLKERIAMRPNQLFSLWLLAGALLLNACAPASIPATATLPPATATLPDASSVPESTGAPVTTAAPTGVPSSVPGDPVRGAQVFSKLPCSSCHDVTHPFPGGNVCPNLGNIATEAARIVKSPDYHGQASDAAGYIRESIVNPNAYIVPGSQYRAPDGQSVMPKNFGQTLTPQQIDDLIAFLLTKQ